MEVKAGVDLGPDASQGRVLAAGVELAVVEAGGRDRPTVLLVHGYPDTKEVWNDVMSRLSERLHVIAYDVRGAGQSSRPRRLVDYDLDRLVDDALAVADARAPGKAVHLVGHDWGSVQGWEIATVARTRGRIASFTSISGPSIDHAALWVRDRLRQPTPAGLLALLGQCRRSWYIAVGAVPVLPGLAWRTVLGPRWPKLLSTFEGVPSGGGHPAPTVAEDAACGLRLYNRNGPRRMRRPRRDAVAHAPVQLIVPSGDHFLSPRLYDDLDRWAPILRRRVIDSGHWAPRTRPDTIARWIGEFVDDVELGAPLRSESKAWRRS